MSFLVGAAAMAAETAYEPNWQSLDARPCPEWFLDAKFGIFIHWGPYSVPAWGKKGEYSEWYWFRMHDKKPNNVWWQFHQGNYGESFQYEDFAPMFRAELFDADKWADVFARSGAKYVVPTSKHHDGFCLWPSAEASKTWARPWNAVDIGPKRDLMAELAEATRKRDLRFGFYYSLYEWYNPLWRTGRLRYVDEHLIPQFKDVVTRYKPAVIFSDGEWEMHSKDWKSEQLLAWLFNESPCKDEVVVNDRWGKDCRHKHGGYWTTEYAAGMKDASHPWEESRGMAYSYGYNRAERIDDYKSGRELIFVLCDLVSRGGNFLLDIGPNADGTIPVIMEERLVEIGDWLRVNGEAIYGTRYAGRDCQWSEGKRPGQKFGEYMVKYNLMEQVGQKPNGDMAVKQAFFTKKSGALYAIAPGWPGKELVLHDLKVPAGATVTMLGLPGALNRRIEGNTLTIVMPDLGPDQAPCRHAYSFKISGAELLPESAAARTAAARGPLQVHSTNPRYFTDGSGKAVFLTGSHTWATLQDQGLTDPPAKFDFDQYLDFLRKYNHNFIRLWSWEQARWAPWIDGKCPNLNDWFIEPNPYARTGPGKARDGKPKFDLSKFDPAYFDRLHERVEKAGDQGIYVSIMLFQGWSSAKRSWTYGGEPWLAHPYNPDNNLQAFNGNLKGDDGPDLNDPRVRERHAAYIRKVIDTVNDLDNVLYEVTNEGGTKDWDWWVVQTVQEYEKTKAKQHPVGLTGHGSERNEQMFSSPADWVSPGADKWPDLKTNPRPARGAKVCLLDTDHVFGTGGDQKWVWKSFMRGYNVLYMDHYDDPDWALVLQRGGWKAVDMDGPRWAMGLARRCAERMDLAASTPELELASTGYCLANPGRQYLIYLPDGGAVTVDLSEAKGNFSVEWMHPITGKTTLGPNVNGGNGLSLAAPFAGDAVLFLQAVE